MGITINWFWTHTNSRRPKTSLWSISQKRGLWRSGDRWSLSSSSSHSRSCVSLNPSCGYFPSSGKHSGIDILSYWQNHHYLLRCLGSSRLFHQQDINSIKRFCSYFFLSKARCFEDSYIFPITGISIPSRYYFTHKIEAKG